MADVNLGEIFIQASQVALKREENQRQIHEFAQKKEEFEQARTNRYMDDLFKVVNIKSPATRSNFLKFMPGRRDAMGIPADRFPDEALKSFSSDEMVGRLATLQRLRTTGKMNNDTLEQALRDPVAMLDVPVTPIGVVTSDPDLQKTIKEIADREALEARVDVSMNVRKETQSRLVEQAEVRQRKQLADAIVGLGLPALNVAFDEINSLVPGGIDKWQVGIRIPGISGGLGAIDTNRLSGSDLRVRQASMAVANNILKMRSGGQIPAHEADRLLTEIGIVPQIGADGTVRNLIFKGITSEEAFIFGMQKIQRAVRGTEKIYKNAFGEERYNSVIGKQKSEFITWKNQRISREQAENFISQPGIKASDKRQLEELLK